MGADEARSLEQMANDPPEAEDDDTGQFTIPGTYEGLSLNAGGKRPQTASMKMNSVQLPVVGQFNNGDILWLHVQVEVTDVTFHHEKKGRQTVGSERRHLAKPMQVKVTEAPDLDSEDNVEP